MLLLYLVAFFAAVVFFLVYANQLLAWKYAVAPKGSAVFITGTSGGIGKAAALHFAALGMVVFGTVRKEADAVELKETLGDKFVMVLCDVAKAEMIEAAAKQVGDECSKRGIQLAAVINNAGILLYDSEENVGSVDGAVLERTLAVNVTGPFKVVEHFLPQLKASKGRVVNVGSYFGSFAPSAHTVSYCASKHAVEGMSDGLRRRLRGDGVYVGLVKPGNIATDMNPRFPETNVSVVTKAMEDAVVSPYPKPRYYPGIFMGRPCWFVCKLFAVLPERLADKLFKLG